MREDEFMARNELDDIDTGININETYLWRGRDVVPAMPQIGRVLGERLLAQLFFFDEASFLLFVHTAPEKNKEEKDYTIRDLISAIEKTEEFENPKRVVLRALDTLLDSGIYKAEWKLMNGHWEPRFFNRSEIAEAFSEDKERLLEPIDPLNPWKSDKTVMSIFKKIYMRDAGDPSPGRPFPERIADTKNSLLQFIKDRLLPELKKYKPGVVLLPAMRKGRIILERLRREVDLNGVEIVYSGYLKKDRFDGRKVILFDDAVNTGYVLYDYYCKLKSIGVDENNILMAAYLINNNAEHSEIFQKYIKDRLIAKPKLLSDDDFHKEVSDILMYIASLGEIIDPDHLLIGTRFANSQHPKDVVEMLESLGVGEILEPNFDYLHPLRKKITLSFDEEEYKKLTDQTFPSHIKEIDLCKIRFIFDLRKENGTYKAQIRNIVPIVLPKISKVTDKEENYILEEWGFDRWQDEKTIDTPPYVDATIYHMTTLFAKSFFKELKKKVELKPDITVDWEHFKNKYDGFDELLRTLQGEMLGQY